MLIEKETLLDLGDLGEVECEISGAVLSQDNGQRVENFKCVVEFPVAAGHYDVADSLTQQAREDLEGLIIYEWSRRITTPQGF